MCAEELLSTRRQPHATVLTPASSHWGSTSTCDLAPPGCVTTSVKSETQPVTHGSHHSPRVTMRWTGSGSRSYAPGPARLVPAFSVGRHESFGCRRLAVGCWCWLLLRVPLRVRQVILRREALRHRLHPHCAVGTETTTVAAVAAGRLLRSEISETESQRDARTAASRVT